VCVGIGNIELENRELYNEVPSYPSVKLGCCVVSRMFEVLEFAGIKSIDRGDNTEDRIELEVNCRYDYH
jgi:hypothetical protein